MSAENRTKRLTPTSESGKMGFPAAPRNSAQFRLMNTVRASLTRATILVVAVGLATGAALAVTSSTTPVKRHRKKKTTVVAHAALAAPPAVTAHVTPAIAASAHPRKKVWVQTWDEPTYKDSVSNDKVDGEDLTVRRAAVDALGPLNGSVVVMDPTNGRVLTIVNQPLALGEGFQPCSTVKVSVALAALREGLVARMTPVKFYSRRSMDLTDALAYSINAYFANLGVKLGYERMNYYAHLFGYGEKAGLNIEGEHAGYFPPAPPAIHRGSAFCSPGPEPPAGLGLRRQPGVARRKRPSSAVRRRRGISSRPG